MLVFEEASGDREAESGSVVGAVGCRGSADAGLEDVWEEVGVDSGSVVLDGDLDGRLVGGGPAELDRGARGAVAERVVEDVGEGAFEAVAVDDDGECPVAVELERVVAEAGRVLEAGRDLLEEVGDGGGFELGRRLGVVVAGVGEEIADQSLERVRSRFGPLEVDGRVAEPGADRLEVSAQREQRRAQVVRDAGDEEPSRLVCLGSSSARSRRAQQSCPRRPARCC